MASQEGRQKGWIALWRKLVNSEIWEQEPWRLKAWLYMLLEANHRDDDQRGLKRGELLVPSIRDFNERLRWKKGWAWAAPPSVAATKEFCRWLRKRRMVATRRTTRGTVITIVNYADYQGAGEGATPLLTTAATTNQPPTTAPDKQQWDH